MFLFNETSTEIYLNPHNRKRTRTKCKLEIRITIIFNRVGIIHRDRYFTMYITYLCKYRRFERSALSENTVRHGILLVIASNQARSYCYRNSNQLYSICIYVNTVCIWSSSYNTCYEKKIPTEKKAKLIYFLQSTTTCSILYYGNMQIWGMGWLRSIAFICKRLLYLAVYISTVVVVFVIHSAQRCDNDKWNYILL